MRLLMVLLLGLAGVLLGGYFLFWQDQPVSMTPQNSPTPAIVSLEAINEPDASPDFPNVLALGDELHAIARKQRAQARLTPFALAQIEPVLEQRFTAFSDLAIIKASEIDAGDGPHDLACIFRGMAADAMRKLEALASAKTMAGQAPVWADTEYLFADVREVLRPGDRNESLGRIYSGETCPAGPTTD